LPRAVQDLRWRSPRLPPDLRQGRRCPDGWLAVAPQPDLSLARLNPTKQNPLIVIAERVEKPGNLGAILRTADAAGADAVIVCDPIADLTNPNVVRASIGALFSVPVATATNAETLAWLRARGIAIVATTPAATQPFTAVDLTGPIAILVGEEKYGLSRFWLDQADLSVLIPMAGKVNSLNVSVSAALLVYEAVKQRMGR
jgi:TrmH family RNA methyltransferase